MADIPEDEELDGEPETPEKPDSYENLVTEEPEREVDPSSYNSKATVSETEEDSPQVSDFKAVVKALTPKFKEARVNDLVQSAMVSRIFPDNMLDKGKITVISLVEEHPDEDENVPVIDYIMNVQDALSIGYEGRGIADRLEAYGAAREEDIEKLAKELG